MGEEPLSIDAAFLCRQRELSLRTFGPGARTWPNWHNADPGKAIEHVHGNTDAFEVSGGGLHA